MRSIERSSNIAARCTAIVCAILLAAFAAAAWSSASQKSPTADESYHAIAGWMHLFKGDFRFDSEDPPAWSMAAAMATKNHGIDADVNAMNWSALPMDTHDEYAWQIKTLFQTPGNDPTAFIARFRAVMLALAVFTGALLGIVVWKIARAGGATPGAAAIATVFSTGLLALDPNFLAHSPLMKNDVGSAAALLGLTFAAWAAGRTLTVTRILAIGLWSCFSIALKFSAPLMIGSVLLLLALRALLPWPWPIGFTSATAKSYVSPFRRLAAMFAALVSIGAMGFCAIWLMYGLRFAPSADAGSRMDMQAVAHACQVKLWQARYGDGSGADAPTADNLAAMPTPMLVRCCLWANDHHLLPQAYLAGQLYVFQSTQVRPTFLCGHCSIVGTWWYFPLAIAVKTPLTTLAVCIALMVAGIVGFVRRERQLEDISVTAPHWTTWTALCLAVPGAIYLATAMASNLNLGLRHVLPIYPPAFAAAGLGIARLWKWRKTAALGAAVLVFSLLTVESGMAYPDFIPFFNVLAGGSRGGFALLSDSNLDWGQDLPALAAWQRQHPDVKLYLAYFGTADPAYYGIQYTNLDAGYEAGPPPKPIDSPGVVAISATTLQGTYCGQCWSALWPLKPFEVLGGSIYLFHVPSTPADHLPRGQSLLQQR